MEGSGAPKDVHLRDMSESGIFICSENTATNTGLDSVLVKVSSGDLESEKERER